MGKVVKKVGKEVKRGVSKIGDVAGDIAKSTAGIPGVNVLTSQLALLDGGPSAVADIWKKNILPEYAMGGLGALSAMGLPSNLSGSIPGLNLGGGTFDLNNPGSVFGDVLGGQTTGGPSIFGDVLNQSSGGGGLWNTIKGGLGSLISGGGRDGRGNWGMLGDFLGGAPGGLSVQSLLGGGAGAQGGGSSLGGLLPLLASGGLGYLLANQGGGGNSFARQQSVMDPATTDYFNRPTRTLDMDSFKSSAQAAGNDPTTHAALNWDKFMRGGGYYNVGAPPATPAPQPTVSAQVVPPGAAAGDLLNPVYAPDKVLRVPAYAKGGGLAMGSSRYVKGSGSGRADTIDAKLSDGEFVVDAETVSMLGDGSNDEGARILEQMRQRVRAHKGKALSKGQFSPNAKSPLAYMKGGVK